MNVCFVIMPIGSGDVYRAHLNRYKYVIEPAVKDFKHDGKQLFDVIRADFLSHTGSITRNVIQHIYNADIVIADLTDLNPNVFYELGVRHSLRTGTILMALNGTHLPFDVGDLRVIFYEDRVGGEVEAIPKIRSFLEDFAQSKESDDSPVFLALPDLRKPLMRDLGEARGKISALESEASDLRVKLAVAEETNLRLRESFGTFERTIKNIMDRFAPEERAQATNAVREAIRRQEDTPRRKSLASSGIDEDPRSIFVLMPLREEFQGVYQVVREVAESLRLKVFRADEMAAPGRITDQILKAIERAGVIIADITGQNANVLYEVGIAHSLNKTTILLSQHVDDVPFDLADMRVVVYENTVTGAKRLRDVLCRFLIHVMEEGMSTNG